MKVTFGYQIISECEGVTTVAILANGSLCYLGAGRTKELRRILEEWFHK